MKKSIKNGPQQDRSQYQCKTQLGHNALFMCSLRTTVTLDIVIGAVAVQGIMPLYFPLSSKYTILGFEVNINTLFL